MPENDMKKSKTCDTCLFETQTGYPCNSCQNAQLPSEADNFSLMWEPKSPRNCSNCLFAGCDSAEYPCISCSKGDAPDMWQARNEEVCIKDSGERRQFESGAVRDICDGKGRCDLLPLDVVSSVMQDTVFTELANFMFTRQLFCLYNVLDNVSCVFWNGKADMFLELAKHFEDGAKKYGERNWELGLPIHCYIDSAVRHYLKCLRGDKDEPHDRAFVWNIVCCIWTMTHKPHMDDLPRDPFDKPEVSDESVSDRRTQLHRIPDAAGGMRLQGYRAGDRDIVQLCAADLQSVCRSD